MSVMLVTGGGRGIGACISKLAARDGWDVAVNYSRSKDRAESVVADIQQRGGRAVAIQADVSDEQQVLNLFAVIDEKLGRVGAVINNAATDHESLVVESRVSDLERVLATNFIGAWVCAREGVKRMARSSGGEGGVIVNISSRSARSGGLPSDVMYASSKGAMDTFTLGLASEVGKEGIRVVAVRPGITRTEIFDNSEGGLERVNEIARRDTAIGRIAEPDEVAELVVWLASDKASYVTGHLYDITGGR